MRGEPAPKDVKLAINYIGGYRNSMSFALTGLDIEAKAELIESQLWSAFPSGKDTFEQVDVNLVRSDRPDPETNELATAWLRVTVKDRDEAKVGRAFANAAVELGLASIPGFYGGSPPGGASQYGVYWPTLIPASLVRHEVSLDGITETGSTEFRTRTSMSAASSASMFDAWVSALLSAPFPVYWAPAASSTPLMPGSSRSP